MCVSWYKIMLNILILLINGGHRFLVISLQLVNFMNWRMHLFSNVFKLFLPVVVWPCKCNLLLKLLFS